jgi:aspartyl-tRNA(Asn)/glutamyl-tRNA(Gln) amidotransferase subunit A
MTDLATLPAVELAARYRKGDLSPVEATRAALDRAHAIRDSHNPFVLIDDGAALASAREAEARWQTGEPLSAIDGVPTTIKDLVLTKGWPTLRGSKAVDPAQPWEDDAPAVARLREAGAVLLGKTTTPEMGWKGVTDSPLTGITRNPWNPERTPGGSSGGAAVAAAFGAGALHIGTDGGGSIRMPAGFSGIFGHKPTFGRVAAWPLSPFGTLANLGPMTRSVTDAALMLNVIGRPDWRDWYSIADDRADYTAGLEDGVAGLRVAFSPTLGGSPVEPGVAEAVAAAVETFRAMGATVVEAEPTLDPAHVAEVFAVHWFSVANTVVGAFDAQAKGVMDAGLVDIGFRGGAYPIQKVIWAQMQRREIGFAINRFFQDHDLLLTPSLPLPAFPVGQVSPLKQDGHAWVDWTPFTYPFNLSRNPACSIPCGFTDGLPVGLQIVGRHYEDALVLRAARAYEREHPIALPRPPA